MDSFHFIALINTVIALYYYLLIVKVMYITSGCMAPIAALIFPIHLTMQAIGTVVF
jgi:NADH:ubiquinone oxidoreductase subunit 2 (subunit N)